MITPERLEAMQSAWVRLLDRFGIGPAAAYPTLDELVLAYSSTERHYHTLEHLGEMFRVAGRLGPQTEDHAAVQLAIWFHDAIYDPRAKDNEARSADLATETLTRLGIPPPVVESVSRLIRATAHLTDDDAPADRDVAVIRDADLAILGASEERYHRYASDIRKEHAWVPDADYRKGRAAVLRAFLARPRIYSSRLLLEEGELQARANLYREMQSCESLDQQSGIQMLFDPI